MTRQSIVGQLLSLPIRGYQKFLSPLTPPRCRYAPTCSQYAVDALRVHGPIKGSILSTWRLLRCNPWSHGGVDHVPVKGSWTAPHWEPPADWIGYQDIERTLPLGMNEAPTSFSGGDNRNCDCIAATQ